jgi:hypothetical protein
VAVLRVRCFHKIDSMKVSKLESLLDLVPRLARGRRNQADKYVLSQNMLMNEDR